MNTIKRYGIWIVVIHSMILLVHELAHLSLTIDLSLQQRIVVVLIFVLTPIATLALLWTNRLQSGFLLLLLGMVAAFVFGVVNHFVFITKDHVWHAPHGAMLPVFQVTAYLMAVVEAIGALLGLWGLFQVTNRATNKTA